uniref:Pentatricopeptide repeat-containing protein n=1 Tax=Cannabis sativa TaxID=3483 RepID=A0A803NGY0_CANSA
MASSPSSSVPLPLSPTSTATPNPNSHSSLTIPPPKKPQNLTIRARLSKLCQEGQPHLARQLALVYAQMKKSAPQTKCDSYTYSSTLKACADTRNLKLGRALHCHILRCISNPSRIVYNSLLNMYAACSHSHGGLDYSKYDLVRKVFDTMPKRNVVAWNTLVSWYVKTERYEQAVMEFVRMMRMRVKPSAVSFVNVFPALSEEAVLDEVSFLSAVTAVSQLQQLKLAQEIHAYVIKKLRVVPLYIQNAVIAMYSRCGSVDISFSIFHGMPERDVVSWNTMVSAFVHNGLDDEALMLVYEMQKQKVTIDSVTVTALLSAASNLRNPNVGKQTHAYLIRNGIEFEGMYSYLIDMYAKSGLVSTLRILVEKSCSHDRDLATWNSMIAGYTQNGLIEEAFMLLRLMMKQKVEPNAVTLASILPACNPMGNIDLGKQLHGFSIRHLLDQNVFHGMGEKALSLFYSMQGSGIKPDAITFVAVLSACSYAGLVEEGLRIFELMTTKEYDIQPSTAHYGCVADLLGRAGRVVEAYDFVRGLGLRGQCARNMGIFSGLQNSRTIQLGKVVAEKLLELGKANDMTGYHVLLSNMYAEEGEWSHVDKLRKQMREKGLWKETGCSWIEISSSVNCFVSKDQKHHQCDEIYDMLGQLAMEMKDAGYQISDGITNSN